MTPIIETQDAPAPAALDCRPVYRWTKDSRIVPGCGDSRAPAQSAS